MNQGSYDSYDECLEVNPKELNTLIAQLTAVGCPRCHAKKEEILGLQGDTATWLFLILSGQIKVNLCDSEGQEQTITVSHDKVILIGESGFFSKKTYNASMIAKTETEYIPISRQQLEEVISAYPPLAWKIMNSMGKKIYHLTCEVAELSFYDTYTRLIEKLLNLASESGTVNECGEVILRMRLTDEELAALLATSREVITRHMSKLQKLGILRREHRQIIISDIAALRIAGARAGTSNDTDCLSDILSPWNT